jgi:hypothetical protein
MLPTTIQWTLAGSGSRLASRRWRDSDWMARARGVRAKPIRPGREGRGEPSLGLATGKLRGSLSGSTRVPGGPACA